MKVGGGGWGGLKPHPPAPLPPRSLFISTERDPVTKSIQNSLFVRRVGLYIKKFRNFVNFVADEVALTIRMYRNTVVFILTK